MSKKTTSAHGNRKLKKSKKQSRNKRKREKHIVEYGNLEPRAMLNATPVANSDLGFSTTIGNSVTIDVLQNDFDAESATLTPILHSNPNNGSVTLNPDSTFTYTPNSGFSGLDFFRYRVSDGTNQSRVKPVRIKVGDGFSARQNDNERTDTGFLHSGNLSLEQPIGSGLSLSYRSDTIPTALVPVETFIAPGTAIPNSITANLTIDGVSSGDVTFTNTDLTTGEDLRFVLRALTPTSSTGLYSWTMSLKLKYTGSTISQNFNGESVLVNRVDSEFGTGWWLNGLDQLHVQPNGALLVNGDGSTSWFKKSGSNYNRAEGDLTFSTLVDNGTNFELTDKWGNKRFFDANGYLTRSKSVNNVNDSFTFSYDSSNRIEKITDEFNREFNFTYSGITNKLISVNDFAGRDSTVTIVNDVLESVTLADEIQTGYTAPEWQYSYTAIGGQEYLTSITDPDNETTDYQYNTDTRRIEQIDHPDSSSWQLFPGLTEGFSAGTGNTVHKVSDSNARFINERGHTFGFSTDRFGNITSMTQPEGGTTEFEFDEASMLYRVTGADPDGSGTAYTSQITEFGYNNLGDMLRANNPDGTHTTSVYDSALRLITQFTNELGQVENFAYDTVGNLTSYTDAEGNQWTYTYNNRGMLLTETTPDPDLEIVSGVEINGPLPAVTTTYTYETTFKDRLEKITWADATFQSFTYTTSDQVATITDELGRDTSYEYDPLDRVITLSMPDPTGGTTTTDYSYEYDSNLQLKKVTDPLGNVTEYVYNNRHWLTEMILPDPDGAGSLTSPKYEYDYDSAGNLISEIRPEFKLGTSITFTYDQNNRMTDMSGPVTGQDYEYVYDQVNRLIETTDPSNRTIKYEYDSRNRLVEVIDHGTLAPTVKFEYDDAGRISKVIDQLNRATEYAYLDNGWLTTTTLPDPDGAGDVLSPVYTNEYDNIGRLTKTIDPSGRFESLEYDTRHRVVTMTGKDPDPSNSSLPALETEFVYDAIGRLLSMSEANGTSIERTTAYDYDDLDRLVKMTLPDPDGAGPLSSPEYQYEYDVVGNVTKTIDPLNRETTIDYDNLYRQTSVSLPDLNGDGIAESVWTFAYNSDALLETVTSPESLTTTRAYDDAGRITAFTNQAGNASTFSYDTLDRLKTITSPDPDGSGSQTSSVTTYNYDIYSRLSSIVDAESGTTSYSYDVANQMKSLTDPSGNTTRWAYDRLGRMTMETDERGYTSSFNHNSVNRVVRTADRNGNIVRFENEGYTSREKWYSSIGAPETSVETTIEGNGTFDERQKVTLSNLSSGDFFRLSFNGEVTAPLADNATAIDVKNALEDLETIDNVSVFKSGSVFTIDFRGDLSGLDVPEIMTDAIADDEGTVLRTLSFEYDEFNRLTSASDTGGSPTYDFGYDAIDRMISQVEDVDWMTSDIELGFAFDAVGNRTSMDALIGANLDYKTTYTYDAQHRLGTVQQTGQSGGNAVADKRVLHSYDDLGRLTFVNRFEGTTSSNPAIRTVFSYNSDGYLTTLQHREIDGSNNTSLLSRYIYSYDKMDRITSINSWLDGVSDFTYDGLSQLTDADHAVSRPDESFNYDGAGNRSGSGYTVDDDNLTSSDGTYNYEYDKEGNRIKRTEISSGDYEEYTWDHRNRLTQIVKKNSLNMEIESVQYEYDVFNRMTQRVHDSNGAMSPGGIETTYFAGFDGMNPTLEFDSASETAVSHRYLWVGSTLIAAEQVTSTSSAGDVLWALTDHLGTIRDIAEFDSSTSKFAISNHRVYDSFGNLTGETDATVDLAFGFTSRWTDEATGMTHHLHRWYDPAIGKWLSDDPIGFSGGFANLQSYVGNQTLGLSDVNGLSPYGGLNGDSDQGGDRLQLADANAESNNYHLTHNGGASFVGYRTGKFFARSWTNVSHLWGAYWETAWDGRQADALVGFATQWDVEVQNLVISAENQLGYALDRGGIIDFYEISFVVNEAKPRYGNYDAFNGGQASAWWTVRAQSLVAAGAGLKGTAATISALGGGGSSSGLALAGASSGGMGVSVSTTGAAAGAGGLTTAGGLVVAGSLEGGILNWFTDPLQMTGKPGDIDGPSSNAPNRVIGKIGDLTKKEAGALRDIWSGGPRSQLPLRVREQLAELYSGVARRNPAGSAQSAFNQARADYLLGRGPNPGQSVVEFAKRHGIPVHRRGGGQ